MHGFDQGADVAAFGFGAGAAMLGRPSVPAGSLVGMIEVRGTTRAIDDAT